MSGSLNLQRSPHRQVFCSKRAGYGFEPGQRLCIGRINRTDSTEGIAGGKEARLGTGPNLVVWSNRRCQSVPDPRRFVPSSCCRTASMITRTTSLLCFSVKDLSDLDNRRVAGSTRLLLLLADLRLVQLVIGVLVTELSLCSSSPAGPHSPRIQPDRPSYIRALLLLALFLPPLVRFWHTLSSFQRPEHRRLQAKISVPHRSYSTSTQERFMFRLNRFKANCTSRCAHPVVQFSSLLDNRYFYRSSTSSHPTIAPTSTSIPIRRCGIVPSHDRIYLWYQDCKVHEGATQSSAYRERTVDYL